MSDLVDRMNALVGEPVEQREPPARYTQVRTDHLVGCHECGVMVHDKRKHDAHHARLDKIERQARKSKV